MAAAPWHRYPEFIPGPLLALLSARFDWPPKGFSLGTARMSSSRPRWLSPSSPGPGRGAHANLLALPAAHERPRRLLRPGRVRRRLSLQHRGAE
jgi:hypothetical protein